MTCSHGPVVPRRRTPGDRPQQGDLHRRPSSTLRAHDAHSDRSPAPSSASSACRNARVDSAPSFSLSPSVPVRRGIRRWRSRRRARRAVAAEEPLEGAHGLPPVPILTGGHLASTRASTSAAASSGCSSPSSAHARGRLARVPPAVADEPHGLGRRLPHLAGVPVEGLESAARAAPGRPADGRPRSAPAAAGRCRRSARPRTSASRGCRCTVEPAGEPTSEAGQSVVAAAPAGSTRPAG